MKLALTISAPNINEDLPLSLLSGDFDIKMQKASLLGYHGIELVVNNTETINHKRILSSLNKFGLEIAAVSTGGLAYLENITLVSPDFGIRKKAFERLKNIIGFTKKIGAPLVTIGSFRGRLSKENYVDDLNYFISVIKLLIEHAEVNDVKLAIEPLNRYECNFLNNIDETLSFINNLGASNLGVLLDTYHANIEEVSMTDCFLRANETQKLWHIHIGDSNRYPPGFGHINFSSILSTLKEINYKYYLSAELLPCPDANKAAEITINYLKPYLLEGNL